ncbi:unnamed protein product [Durusdinium trenchii]|uniref:Uncharacterized protein n=1 Tax=Durusdinium trenchii TaxID=1381693 RepID=A0ABP0JKJ5_9DINO
MFAASGRRSVPEHVVGHAPGHQNYCSYVVPATQAMSSRSIGGGPAPAQVTVRRAVSPKWVTVTPEGATSLGGVKGPLLSVRQPCRSADSRGRPSVSRSASAELPSGCKTPVIPGTPAIQTREVNSKRARTPDPVQAFQEGQQVVVAVSPVVAKRTIGGQSPQAPTRMIKSSGSCPGILPAVAEDEPYKVRHGDVDLNRLQWLENELEMFKGKMLEMRSAADTLSKEVRVSCRSPAPRGGDSLSTTDTSTPEEKVLESIKHVLREEECDRSQKGQKELMEEVRQLRQALRLESEARTQLSSKMEVVLTEKRANESIRSQLASVEKEQPDVRGEGMAAKQAQKAVKEFVQLRERFHQEMTEQKAEIGNAIGDLSRLIDRARCCGLSGEMEPSSELKESERQSIAARCSQLEVALKEEVASRKKDTEKLHKLLEEHQQCQMEAFQRFERGFTSQLQAAISEAREAKLKCAEEAQLWQRHLAEETKDREDTAMKILKAVEDRMASDLKHWKQLFADQQAKIEEAAHGHDLGLAKFVEKYTKDLSELREEIKEVCWNLSQPAEGMTSVEIEELRTLMATERVAREQDVDRCMGSIQDLFEEQKRRGHEIQALEQRLKESEVALKSSPTSSTVSSRGSLDRYSRSPHHRTASRPCTSPGSGFEPATAGHDPPQTHSAS